MNQPTNKFGIPDAIYRALCEDRYYAGPEVELTASSLGGPPRIRQLFLEHSHEIVEDATDRFHLWQGKIVHEMLDRAGRGAIREKRFYFEVAGAKLSAAPDNLELRGRTLREWKHTSVWSVVYGGRTEWEGQVNAQAEALIQNGLEIDHPLEVWALLKDHSKDRALEALEKGKPETYPQAPIVYYPIRLWSREERHAWITSRIDLHRRAALGDVADCTPEERWERTPGDAKRCRLHCQVSKWCPQWAELQLRPKPEKAKRGRKAKAA